MVPGWRWWRWGRAAVPGWIDGGDGGEQQYYEGGQQRYYEGAHANYEDPMGGYSAHCSGYVWKHIRKSYVAAPPLAPSSVDVRILIMSTGDRYTYLVLLIICMTLLFLLIL